MFPFSSNFVIPRLPKGYVLNTEEAPNPTELNRLLSRCRESTHPPIRLAQALDRSAYYLSIIKETNGRLSGFVRATSDLGLNANLWNLVAEPGDHQMQLLSVLVFKSITFLRKDMPGCSISVSAPTSALPALRSQGFLVDPGGIRAMGYKLK